MIDTWFIEKGSYQQGLELLQQACGANKRIYQRLKNSKNSLRNMAALKYELQKYRYKVTPETRTLKNIVPKAAPQKKSTEIPKQKAITSVENSNARITISMLNDHSLQLRYIEKNKAFYERWMLKKQLNALPSENESEALDIIVQMMKLTTLIDTIWGEIDYFLAYKRLMPSPGEYRSLSLSDQIKTRQRLYQKRTKRKATLAKWQHALASTPATAKAALQAKIEKQQNTINQLSIDITALNRLIDE